MKKDIIEELADLGSKHKLVPFLGAGCSIPHLSYDWNDIRDDLARIVDTKSKDHLKVAQEYIDKFGKDKFCNYLKEKLLIEDFMDKKGYTHLAVMSWGLGVIYTTNQDNVMEKCFEKYGRKYSKIVTLKDLGQATPGDKLYIKFHGDLFNPESVVFGTDDYNNRIDDIFNFLNIRLRSDLLAKSLIFIGYSLRDENIQLLLEELKIAFAGELPQSYMIAWEYNKELQEICDKFGVELIDPLKVFPACNNNIEAFEVFLAKLVEKILELKTSQQINDIFRPSIPPTQRVVSRFEIESAKKVINKGNFSEGYEKFRAIFDRSLIPKDFEVTVVEMFSKLADKCSNIEESNLLNAAYFNLILSEPMNKFEVLISLMTTVNERNSTDIFDSLYIKSDIPEDIYILAVPIAIERLADLGREITDAFRVHVTDWIEKSIDIKELDKERQDYIKKWIDYAWSGSTVYEHPLKRKQRLKKSGFNFTSKSRQVSKRIMEAIPKRYEKPYEG